MFPELILPKSLAVWDPLGGTQEPVMTGHDGVCVHTMAGTFAGTDSWFHQNGWTGTESTVGVAGSGFCKQWVSWGRQADANLQGNARWLSIECADAGENFPPLSTANDESPPLTADQVEKIIDLCVYWCSKTSHAQCPSTWKCHNEGIPARYINNSCERGIGVHRHGIDPWRNTSCPKWSGSSGKICPRSVRLRQVRDVIVPAVARRLAQDPSLPTLEDIDMPFEIYDGRRVRGVVGGLIGYSASASRSELRKAFADAGVPYPVVRVSQTWFDVISKATSIHGAADEILRVMRGYWGRDSSGARYLVYSDHSGKIPPGPLQSWAASLNALGGHTLPDVTVPDDVLAEIPTIDEVT